ncbi:MAG: hypothetical protein WC824_13195 [Bacteroidota bacterium]|jgi:hypothetical protein
MESCLFDSDLSLETRQRILDDYTTIAGWYGWGKIAEATKENVFRMALWHFGVGRDNPELQPSHTLVVEGETHPFGEPLPLDTLARFGNKVETQLTDALFGGWVTGALAYPIDATVEEITKELQNVSPMKFKFLTSPDMYRKLKKTRIIGPPKPLSSCLYSGDPGFWKGCANFRLLDNPRLNFPGVVFAPMNQVAIRICMKTVQEVPGTVRLRAEIQWGLELNPTTKSFRLDVP